MHVEETKHVATFLLCVYLNFDSILFTFSIAFSAYTHSWNFIYISSLCKGISNNHIFNEYVNIDQFQLLLPFITHHTPPTYNLEHLHSSLYFLSFSSSKEYKNQQNLI